MPWNGSGSFTSIFNWEADAAASIPIEASRMDTQEADYTNNGFDNCLTRDGQGVATADLPMAGFRHTGVGNAVAATDYAAYGQVISAAQGALSWVAAAGTSDAITATYSPAVTALVDGQVLYFRATAANLTTTPTFKPNAVTAEVITKNGGQALAVGDIPGSLAEVGVRYNLANTRWELLNPPDVPIGGTVPFFGGTLPSGFVLPTGQNLAAATYPAANVVLGTTYGSPGGGNFTMPDVRGTVTVGIDTGGTHLSGVTTLGATTGGQNQTIAQANLPSVNFTNGGITITASAVDAGHVHTVGVNSSGSSNTAQTSGAAISDFDTGVGVAGINTTSSVTAQGHSASGGSGTALPVVQPTLAVNVMMRIA